MSLYTLSTIEERIKIHVFEYGTKPLIEFVVENEDGSIEGRKRAHMPWDVIFQLQSLIPEELDNLSNGIVDRHHLIDPQQDLYFLTSKFLQFNKSTLKQQIKLYAGFRYKYATKSGEMAVVSIEALR